MNRTRLFFLIGACVLIWPCTAAWGQSLTSKFERARMKQRRLRIDRTLIVLGQLNKVVPAVDFDDEPFKEVLDWFREQGLGNIVVHWRKLEDFGEIDRSTAVTLQVADMTLGELLDLVLGKVSAEASRPDGRLLYRIANGIVEISTREDYADEIVVRTYPVEDLLQGLIYYDDAPEVSVAGSGGEGGGGSGRGGRGRGGSSGGGRSGGGRSGGGSGTGGPGGSGGRAGGRGSDLGGIFQGTGGGEQIDFEGRREEQLEKLIDLIKKIRPRTWQDAGGKGTIAEFRGKLMISQTIEMHEIIGGRFRLGAGKR